MATRALLEDAIRDDPDDAGHYLALGDLLQQAGDPRGHLIALQQAARPELDGEIAAWLARHPELLGELAAHLASCELTWEHGFIRAAAIDALDDGAALVAALLGSPSARFLRALRLVVGHHSYRAALAVLASAPRPTVRSLAIADTYCPDRKAISRIRIGSLGAVSRALPRLGKLVVQGHAELDDLATSQLVHFELHTRAGVSREAIAAVLERPWPMLEELVLWIDTQHPVELTALADPARFPRLVRLGLRYSALGDATCDALARMLVRLDSLDLRGGTISDAGAAVLAAHAPPRLALAVDDNLIGSAGQAVLAARGPRSSIGTQRPPSPAQRAAQTRHPERLPPASDVIAEHLRAASRHRAGHDLVAQIAALREAVAVAVVARYHSREASIRDTLAHALHDNGRLLEARHELERALALFERAGEPSGIRRARQMLALVLLELGDDAAGTALAARFQDDGDPEERAHSLVALAGHASGRGDHAKARGLYEQAGMLVAGQPYERHIKHMLAVMDQLQNDLAGARRGYEHVLAQLQGDGDVRERAKVLQNVAGVYWLQSEWARAEAAYREAGALSVRVGDRRNQAHVLSNLGNLLNWRGDYAASVATAEQAVQLFRDIGFADGLRSALGMAADANLQAGHFDQAQRLSAEALAAGREVGDPAAIALGLKIHADLAKHRWELDDAERLCHEALAIYRDSHNAYGIAGALLGIAHLQLARGDLAGPEPLIIEAAGHYATRGLDHGWAAGAHALLELARGDTMRAVERCRDALDLAIAGVNPVQIRRLTARYAAVLAAHGDVATARDHLATAAALFADVGDALGTAHLDVCGARVSGTTAPPRPAPFEARLMWQLLFADV